MFKLFFGLESKKFLRSATLKTDLVINILKLLGILYLVFIYSTLGFGFYYWMEELNLDALEQINKFMIYYFAFELLIRFLFQKMPTANIKPLLVQNISRKNIVNYYVGKMTFGIFNLLQLFFLITFTAVLIIEKGAPMNAICWSLSIYLFIYCLHFINTLLNKNKTFFISALSIILVIGVLHYYIIDLTIYTEQFFACFYTQPLLIIFPFLLVLTLAFFTYRYFLQNLYLEDIFSKKGDIATNNELKWLEVFGQYAPFLKNDLRLIARNKRAKTTVIMGLLFLFYGFLILSSKYDFMATGKDLSILFAGIIVTGGFLLSFGQYVPSWESSYYPLMMTRKITYHNYLESKWVLIVSATILSIILSSFYLFFFNWQVYAIFVACGFFNIGVNSYLVLFGGAYLKSPIDLSSNKNIMYDSKGFSFKVILISLPKLILPFILYYIGKMIYGFEGGIALLVIPGILGIMFKKQMFHIVEKIYKKEKYDTLQAYKQK